MVNVTNKNQEGFGVIEILVAGIVIGLICLVGWYYFKSSRPADKPKTVPQAQIKSGEAGSKIYTNSTSIYSVIYPQSWAVSEATADNSSWYLADYDLADTKYASFTPPNAPLSGAVLNLSKNLDDTPNSVSVFAFRTNDTKDVLKKWNAPEDKVITSKDLKINGYRAAYTQTSTTSNQDASSIEIKGYASTVDSYAVTNNGITLLIIFMEKQSSDEQSEAKTFDATSNVPQFDNIAKSVKFLN